ncbi:MAG: D-alanyl-D-alanine carboxypeptidase family protein [Evtepia sp.]|uniref:D-alanyl-D-alanine carboxypeptidase family protein n=1 Tax=Evtepia sp. TaxID=2773933 RepID=UPI002A74DE47|nr:D-alanyl-D-alanine carboxypeptidase family protein [Evtepia sp.]MDY3014747.1 D-alanyl-D-alanine carboxypeptidase family protein [Evtepia sp.]
MTPLCLPEEARFSGPLILVNPAYPYRSPAPVSLTPVPEEPSSVLLAREAAQALNDFIASLGGWASFIPVSGWRSQQEQQTIWDDSLRDNGLAFTQTYVALPGHSEHQTGLAIDLGYGQEPVDFIRPAFPYAGICQAFRETMARYGFIQRYPSEKETITGIGHEPWHFRYVGTPHAQRIQEMGITLEEYLDWIRAYPWEVRPYEGVAEGQLFRISFRPAASDGPTVILPHPGWSCTVSGNNIDGFLITEWRQNHG